MGDIRRRRADDCPGYCSRFVRHTDPQLDAALMAAMQTRAADQPVPRDEECFRHQAEALHLLESLTTREISSKPDKRSYPNTAWETWQI